SFKDLLLFFCFPKKTAATAKPPGHSADNTACEPVFAPSPRQRSPSGDWRSFPPKAIITKKVYYFPPLPLPTGGSKGGSLVSAAASVGDGRSPLATIAPL